MAASHPTNSLPVRLTPFVGRRTDRERILDLLQSPAVRLVTILGVGGVGKTRLALEAARVLLDRFQNGAVFVPLAHLNTIDELLPALAAALGVQLPPGGDLEQAVLEQLAGQQILLVLDSFEHLLDEAALVSDILISCPQVTVVVTSREKLNLEVETLYHLGGLELPPLDGPQKSIEQYDAVSLFLQKAAQAYPGFALTPANTEAVIQICHLVDGNPLGILLAAAWLEYFSPADIAKEIRNNLDFLSGEARDAEPRHYGMRAVFDSSFNRLDAHLRSVFQKLSVFRGGFDLTAAASVAGADLRTLIALVDKSLLTRDPQAGRYEPHELLRHYAGERLAAAGEREKVLDAFAEHYMAFVRLREKQLISPSQTAALDEIQADFDNIREAFARVIENHDFESARTMLPGLYAFCDMRSRFYEGEALFRLASEKMASQADGTPDPAWALALLSWYDMRAYIEPFESFQEIALQARRSLEQAVSTQDVQATAASLVLLGVVAQHQGDLRTALQNFERAMQSCPLLDDVYFVNIRIGLCYQALKDYPKAIQAFQTSLQRGKQTGERVKMGWSLENIADTLLLQGDPAEAERPYEQACTLFEEVGTTVGVIWCLYGLSRAAIASLNPTRGREFAERAGKLARQIHSAFWITKLDDLLHQIDPQFRQPLAERNQGDEAFSPRELEVLSLLRSDLSGPAIARKLVVSLNTVRYHTKNIYRKLGAATRLEAIQRAKDLGL